MQLHQSLFLAAGLGLAGCAGTSVHHNRVESAQSAQLTVHVVEASGGAWSASKSARAAVENLNGVDRFMMSGTRATLVLADGAQLTEAEVKQAVEDKGLKFESFEQVVVQRPAAAYVAKTPKFTWAATARKVRATLMKDVAGVQDVFCGPETVVHMKQGSATLAPELLEKVFEGYEIACDGIVRDDSKVL